MSQRNKSCPVSQQPRARSVRRNTSADVLNQAFIYPNSNDYRRKRISNQFFATQPAKRDPSNSAHNQAFIDSRSVRSSSKPASDVHNQAFIDSRPVRRNSKPASDVLNQAFIDSRPVRRNSKPASDVHNQAFICPSSNLQRKRTSNQYGRTSSGNIANNSFIEPRRYKEHSNPSSHVLNQGFIYPRSNQSRSSRPVPRRETINAAGRISNQAGRDSRPVRRNSNVATNIRNQASTYSNSSKLRKDGYREQSCQRPPVARARSGHAPLIPEHRIKCRKPTSHQNLAFRVQCTPQVLPLSTFSSKICAVQQNNSALTVRTVQSAPLCHPTMPSATNLVYSPNVVCPDKKRTQGMMPTRESCCRSVPNCCQNCASKAKSSKSDFLSRQDAKTDCFDDLKESFAEFQVEFPKEFFTDPSKRQLLRAFLNDLKRDKCSANPSASFSERLESNSTQAAPTTKSTKSGKFQKGYKKTDEERTKKKELLIKHLRSTLKEKIPQLKLVVKMLELIMSWKHLRSRGNHERSNSDETTALGRDELVNHIDQKPGWCHCDKKKSDQLPSQKAIKQETPFQNFALKPEPR